MEIVAAKTVLDLDQIHTFKVASSPKRLLGTTDDSTGSSGSGGSLKVGLTLSRSPSLSGLTANDGRRAAQGSRAGTQPTFPMQTPPPSSSQDAMLWKEDSTESIASVMSVKDMVVSLCSASPKPPSIIQRSSPSPTTSESIDSAVLGALKPLLATKSIQLPEKLNNGNENLGQASLPMQKGTRLGGGWRQGQGGGQSAGLLNWLSNKAEANPQAKVVIANISANASAPPVQSRALIKVVKPRKALTRTGKEQHRKRNEASERMTSSAESASLTNLLSPGIEPATRERVSGNEARTAPSPEPKPQLLAAAESSTAPAALRRRAVTERPPAPEKPVVAQYPPDPQSQSQSQPQLLAAAESSTAPAALRRRAVTERPPVAARSQSGQRCAAEGLTIPRRQCGQVLRLQAMIAGPTPTGRRLYLDMPPLLPAGSSSKTALLPPGSKAPEAEKAGSYERVTETSQHSGNSQPPAMEGPEVAFAPEEEEDGEEEDEDGEDSSLLSDDGSETESIAPNKELLSDVDEVDEAEDEVCEAPTADDADSLAPCEDEAGADSSAPISEEEAGADSLALCEDEARAHPSAPIGDEAGARSSAPCAAEADLSPSAHHLLPDVRDADIVNGSLGAQPPQLEAPPVKSSVLLDDTAGKLLESLQRIASPPRPYLRLRDRQSLRKSTKRSSSENWSALSIFPGGNQQAQLASSPYADMVINGSPTGSRTGVASDSPQRSSQIFRPEDIRQQTATMAQGYHHKSKSSFVDDPEEPFLVTPWSSVPPAGDESLCSQDGASGAISGCKSMGNLNADAARGIFLPAINAEDALRRLRHAQSIPRAASGAEHATHSRPEHRRKMQNQRSFSSCSSYQPGSGYADLKLPPIHLRHQLRRSSAAVGVRRTSSELPSETQTDLNQ